MDENFFNAHKTVQKSSKTLKLNIHNFVSTWTDISKILLSFTIGAVLGSHRIVIKCRAAFFSYVGFTAWLNLARSLNMPNIRNTKQRNDP